MKGLHACIVQNPDDHRECKSCPYRRRGITNEPCFNGLMIDAIALLKEQEARVLSAEEIRSGEAVVVWLEDKDRENVIPGIWFRLSNEGGDEAVDIHVMDGFIGARLAEYNKRWRAWTAHPSDEQRKAVKWDA